MLWQGMHDSTKREIKDLIVDHEVIISAILVLLKKPENQSVRSCCIGFRYEVIEHLRTVVGRQVFTKDKFTFVSPMHWLGGHFGKNREGKQAYITRFGSYWVCDRKTDVILPLRRLN